MSTTVVIAAGGTGGHIFPALAIADAIKKNHPSWKIHFAGACGGMEEKIVPGHGYEIFLLPIGRLNHNVSMGERLFTLFLLPWSILRAIFFVLKTRPRFVLGVGGHASAPVLLAASFLRRKTFIWEPNAYPGLANRWLSRFVDESLVVFEEATKHLKTSKTFTVGMPVRESITQVANRSSDSQDFRVLVFGGSQGARGINNAVSEMIVQFGDNELRGIKFVHQTGPYDFERIKSVYGGLFQVEVREFLHDMDQRYAWADLVICRSGTGTLFELAACGKPAILIPLPTAADNHQQKNAESLVSKGAAEMILQKDLSPLTLKNLILTLKNDPKRREAMAEKIRSFHRPRAAEKIVEHIVKEAQ